MRSILAIARLTIRAAFRSKVVWGLLAMLLVAIVGLPWSVKDDGTLGGKVQIVLSYSLRSAQAILAVATVWLGAAAVSGELRDRTLQLVLVKPVGRLQVWLGKWLGLLTLNGGLLLLAGLSVAGVLHLRVDPDSLDAEEARRLKTEILVARRVILPEPVDVSARVEEAMQQRTAGVEMTAVERARLQENLTHEFLMQANSVPQGLARGWRFTLPDPPDPEHPVLLQWSVSVGSLDRPDMMGLWLPGPNPASAPRYEVLTSPGGVQTRPLPPEAFVSDQVVEIGYANTHPEPITVIFDPQDGVLLLQRAGGFYPNLARTLTLQFVQLALVSALAISCGALFSMPVAVFVSGSLLFLQLFSGMIRRVTQSGSLFYDAEGAAGFFEPLLILMYRILSVIISPVASDDPLGRLATGKLVATGEVVRAVAVHGILLCGLLGVLAVWLFNRREVGKAT